MSIFSKGLGATYKFINRYVEWHKLPTPLAIGNLLAFRNELREKNLYDTGSAEHPLEENGDVPTSDVIHIRTSNGVYNDLGEPHMGSAGTRFGRNMPLEYTYPEAEPAILEPSPRLISEKLLKRDTFLPVEGLNLLAAAWIQFQTHDWFNHGDPDLERNFELSLEDGDSWYEDPMRIPKTMVDPTRGEDEVDKPPTYINPESHWWDLSSIYGSTDEITNTLRSFEDGKLIIGEDGRLPIDPEKGISRTGFNDNWWVGLIMLHHMFTLEHNAICDHLRRSYPSWTDEQLFQKARLINAALGAKIHTVEWTPAILQHPALQIGMRANWWGLAEEKIYRLFGRLSKSEVVSGIPGSEAEHHDVPFSLTEEFAAVYRLHPLLPDDYEFHSATTGKLLKEGDLNDIFHDKGEVFIDDVLKMDDVIYSFGIMHPGAVTLHNFPNTLRDLTKPDGLRLDLAAVDIMRDRERGIPRYNQFRRLLHMKPAKTFEDITDNQVWADEIREVYQGDVERVDLMVGMFAETPPKGFGFSDTAFRIFILMASRRLKSDRFFTDDYTPRVYTPEGIKWVDDNDMSSIILRHYPSLSPALSRVENAFFPWAKIGQA